MPALTTEACQVLSDFAAHGRSRRWAQGSITPAMRTLRTLLAHLGVSAPLLEEDVRLLARRHHCAGARVVGYLRLTGQLVPDRTSNAALGRARCLADTAPDVFRIPLNRWIDVLCAAGSRPSRPLAPYGRLPTCSGPRLCCTPGTAPG
ncbi:hypothetical protein ACIBU0_44190 [Streptomyces sp. NPDC049627]|uniref:hypothetical protein n=1 Tax=Streptomyces sp. NPDC049627 TaxID=3365595 RepID=UPI0037A483EE